MYAVVRLYRHNFCDKPCEGAFGNPGLSPDLQCPRILQNMVCVTAFEQGGYHRIRHWAEIFPELYKAGHATRIVYLAPMSSQRVQMNEKIAGKQRAQHCMKLFGLAFSSFLQGHENSKFLIYQVLVGQIGCVRLAMNKEPAQMRHIRLPKLIIH